MYMLTNHNSSNHCITIMKIHIIKFYPLLCKNNFYFMIIVIFRDENFSQILPTRNCVHDRQDNFTRNHRVSTL